MKLKRKLTACEKYLCRGLLTDTLIVEDSAIFSGNKRSHDPPFSGKTWCLWNNRRRVSSLLEMEDATRCSVVNEYHKWLLNRFLIWCHIKLVFLNKYLSLSVAWGKGKEIKVLVPNVLNCSFMSAIRHQAVNKRNLVWFVENWRWECSWFQDCHWKQKNWRQSDVKSLSCFGLISILVWVK